jgi:hypothetical protein
MRSPQGYCIISTEGAFDIGEPVRRFSASDLEWDCVTCGHCNRMDRVPPGMQPGDMCKGCMRFLCERCYAKWVGGAGCTPFEKRLDAYEKSVRGR